MGPLRNDAGPLLFGDEGGAEWGRRGGVKCNMLILSRLCKRGVLKTDSLRIAYLVEIGRTPRERENRTLKGLKTYF